MFSKKLIAILEKRLTIEELTAMPAKPNTPAFVAKLELFQALFSQFDGKAITRDQFDALNSKPTNIEKVKNLVNYILDATVNYLFNSDFNRMVGVKLVEHNTTARHKNTFNKRVKALKQVANTTQYGGLGL